ncbi:hypothetical protein TIFTF001_000547 [Ficus carica]|uniref:Nudix hydrolase domain-containing protein n=1 Tax=Ficus carica TaxID=3494 RepID=A0AA87ZDT4_FICCA|nr:hypothetical protein TIFTF001_000547 [Ficus carica]
MEKTEITDPSRPPYKLLLSCTAGLSPSPVLSLLLSVVFDQSYDRIPHPDTNLENSVSENSVVICSSSLMNFSKLTSIFDPIARQDFCRDKLESSVGKVPDDPVRCQHTSSPLGNGAIIETLDRKILVLKRSNNVGEFPGHFVFPGGHPEPEENGIAFHQHGKNSIDYDVINKKVSQEMFDSIIREVVEETGVPATSLSEPVFIGVSRRELNVRPAAFFFIKCTLESDEIQKLYSNAQDGFESTQIYTVSMTELENMTSKMPGCHHGGFALYKLMVEAQKDI